MCTHVCATNIRLFTIQNNGSFGPFDVQEERTEAGILMNFVKTSDVSNLKFSLKNNYDGKRFRGNKYLRILIYG